MTDWTIIVVTGLLLVISGISKGIMDTIAKGIWKGWWNKQDSWQYKYKMHIPRYLLPKVWWDMIIHHYKKGEIPYFISMIVCIGAWILVAKGEVAGHPLLAQLALYFVIIMVPILWYDDFIKKSYTNYKIIIPKWLSSTLLVPMSDGWHFFQMITNSCWQFAFAFAYWGDISWITLGIFVGIKWLFNGAFSISHTICAVIKR